MIWRIARKEWLEAWRDRRLIAVAAPALALVLIPALAAWPAHSATYEQRLAAQRGERERWLHQGETSPHDATHHGLYVFRLPETLATFDSGALPYIGEAAFLEGDNTVTFLFKPAADAPAAGRFGELTVAIAWQVLLPLLIVLLSHGLFANERETGTLRQLWSLGLPLRVVVSGKLLGALGALLSIVLPAGAAVGFMLWSRSDHDQEFPRRLAWWLVAYAAYFSIVLLLCLTVSALCATSRQSLAILLLFWFGNSLLAPPLAASLAQLSHPSPAALEFANALRRQERDTRMLNDIMTEVEARLLRQYRVSDVTQLPVNPKGVALLEIEAEKARRQELRFDELQQTFARQGAVYQAISWFAPMLAVQSVSMALAGTDATHHLHFARAAEQYRRDLVRRMNEDDARNRKPDMAPYLPNLRGDDLWETVPPFQYSPPSLRWSLNTVKTSGTVLWLWLAGGCGAAFLAFRRLKVS